MDKRSSLQSSEHVLARPLKLFSSTFPPTMQSRIQLRWLKATTSDVKRMRQPFQVPLIASTDVLSNEKLYTHCCIVEQENNHLTKCELPLQLWGITIRGPELPP